MKFLIEMGIKNAFKSKIRLIFIPLLIACGLLVIGISFNVYNTVIQDLKTLEEDVSSAINITVYNDNKPIPMASVKKMEQMEGIESISLDHYCSCYLGDKEQDSISFYHIIEFDFEEHKLIGAEDYRGKNASGIVLPESYDLSQLSGSTKLYCDYMEDDKIKTYVTDIDILGYYRYKSGDGERVNDAYMSSGLYKELIKAVGATENPIGLKIYLSDVEKKDDIMSQIKNMGYSAFSQDNSWDDYLLFISGVRNTGFIFGLVLIILSVIIVLQTLNASIRRREKTIGLMKTFGYKDRSILLMICMEFSVYAVISLIITTAVNILLSEPLSELLSFAAISRDYSYSFSQFLAEAASILVLMILSVISPWRKCVAVDPITVLKSSN